MCFVFFSSGDMGWLPPIPLPDTSKVFQCFDLETWAGYPLTDTLNSVPIFDLGNKGRMTPNPISPLSPYPDPSSHVHNFWFADKGQMTPDPQHILMIFRPGVKGWMTPTRTSQLIFMTFRLGSRVRWPPDPNISSNFWFEYQGSGDPHLTPNILRGIIPSPNLLLTLNVFYTS